jgi:hypothetical protein
MKKIIWIPLIILIIGVCIAFAGFANGGLKGFWIERGGFHLVDNDAGKLVKVDEKYDGFKDIIIDADFFERIDVKEGDRFAVRGQNYERFGGLEVRLDGDTIRIDSKADRRWSIDFGVGEWFNNHDTWLEITYPAGAELGVVDMKLSTGGIFANGIGCDELIIKNSFGNIEAKAVRCGRLDVNAAAGEIDLNDAVVSGNASIDNDFGDVAIGNIQAGSFSAKLDSGKLEGSKITADTVSFQNSFGKIEVNGLETDNLTADLNSGDLLGYDVSAKDLTITNDFGKIKMERLAFTGHCEIDNSSGDIGLELLMDIDSLSYELKTDAGSVSIDGQKSNGSVSSRVPGSSASLNASTDFGSIQVDFLR